jgi:hypothetical protein
MEKNGIINKINKLLMLAESTTFPDEADSAEKLAHSFAEKNGLLIEKNKEPKFRVKQDEPKQEEKKNNEPRSKNTPKEPYGPYTFDPVTMERVYKNGYRMKDLNLYRKYEKERYQAEQFLKNERIF